MIPGEDKRSAIGNVFTSARTHADVGIQQHIDGPARQPADRDKQRCKATVVAVAVPFAPNEPSPGVHPSSTATAGFSIADNPQQVRRARDPCCGLITDLHVEGCLDRCEYVNFPDAVDAQVQQQMRVSLDPVFRSLGLVRENFANRSPRFVVAVFRGSRINGFGAGGPHTGLHRTICRSSFLTNHFADHCPLGFERRRLGERAIPEVQHGDPLVTWDRIAYHSRSLAYLALDRRSVEIAGRFFVQHHNGVNDIAQTSTTGQAKDTQLLGIRQLAVSRLDLVGIDVLARAGDD